MGIAIVSPIAAAPASQRVTTPSAGLTIMHAREGGFLIAELGATSFTQILACFSTAEDAAAWAAKRLSASQARSAVDSISRLEKSRQEVLVSQ